MSFEHVLELHNGYSNDQDDTGCRDLFSFTSCLKPEMSDWGVGHRGNIYRWCCSVVVFVLGAFHRQGVC